MDTDHPLWPDGTFAAAIGAVRAAGDRIAKACERLHAQPPSPIPSVREDETRAQVAAIAAEARGDGWGVSVSVNRHHVSGTWYGSCSLVSPRGSGSVADHFGSALTPSQVLAIEERLQVLAAKAEALATAHEAEVADAIEAARASEDAAIRALAGRIAEQRERQAQNERAAAARAAGREAWIREHGSERLRALLEEGFELGAVYRDERDALEIPAGWVRDIEDIDVGEGCRLFGTGGAPRNPSLEAVQALRAARAEMGEDAEVRLGYVSRYRTVDPDDEDEDEQPDEDGEVRDGGRLVLVAKAWDGEPIYRLAEG